MDPLTSEPIFTNCTRDFLGTLDYIFFTGEVLHDELLNHFFNLFNVTHFSLLIYFVFVYI